MDDKNFDRIILINWRFDAKHVENWDVNDSSDCQVICKNENDAEKFKNFWKTLEAKNILVLFHDNNPNKDVAKSLMTVPNTTKTKYFPFKEGEDPIYAVGEYDGFLNANASTFDSSCLENLKIKKEHFDFVWNYYWNELDLKNQKKKLINLWLPLAIDAIGLKEVIGKKDIYRKYIEEVKEDINANKDNITREWEEIIKIIAPAENNEVLEEKYKLLDKEKEIIKKLDSDELKNDNYLLNKVENGVEKNLSLDKWLNEVIKILNTKLLSKVTKNSTSESPNKSDTVETNNIYIYVKIKDDALYKAVKRYHEFCFDHKSRFFELNFKNMYKLTSDINTFNKDSNIMVIICGTPDYDYKVRALLDNFNRNNIPYKFFGYSESYYKCKEKCLFINLDSSDLSINKNFSWELSYTHT